MSKNKANKEKWKCDELFNEAIKKLLEMEKDDTVDKAKLKQQEDFVLALMDGDLKYQELHKKPDRKRLDPNCLPALISMAVVAIAPYAVEKFGGRLANHMKPKVETPKFWHI